MSKEQLDNLKKKLRAFPQVEQYGRLLHIHKPLADFHEWSVLTYNLNVLGDIVRENMELHNNLDLLTEKYINQVEALRSSSSSHYGTGKGILQTVAILPPEPSLGSSNPSVASTMMNQKIKDVSKRLDRLEDLIMNKLAGCG